MTNYNTHNTPGNPPEFFPKANIAWKKSREEIWNDLSSKLGSENKPSSGRIVTRWNYIAAAAIIIVLIAVPTAMRLYTVNLTSPPGKHLSVSLPDGSTVVLNAATHLSYHKYWWAFSRKVQLEGEAYFTVKKGKSFEVVSPLGKVSVLGTSFNIYARKLDYNVACFTGKVRVVPRVEEKSPLQHQEVNLEPNDMATLTGGGSLIVERGQSIQHIKAWTKNEFNFTAAPITRVMEEIGLQYGILIKFQGNLNYLYTGNFARDSSVENVLNLVCRPFDMKYLVDKNGQYLITENN